jgi:aryl-alcohol dehydrogenase-like predicted oxidoreductase
LPVIGLGTWSVFDVGPGQAERAGLGAIVRALLEGGGATIDSSPMYGRAEGVVGDLLREGGLRPGVFLATKVWTRGRSAGVEQMERSMRLLGADTIDLMQVHNLVDHAVHLDTLRGWQREGRVRYVGVTHYTPTAFAELERVLRQERLDFVQLNYAIDDREAEQRLLPLARERGIAVIVNRPFGGGSLFAKLRGKALPGVAVDLGCANWAQLSLKYVLGHPAVTCVIPATGNAAHLSDNLAAGDGPLPDDAQRAQIRDAFDAA